LDVRVSGYSNRGALTGLEREIDAELQRIRPLDNPNSFYLPFESMAHATRRATRALTVAAGNAGGYLVESEIHPLIDALRPNCNVIALGAQVLPGQIGNFVAPSISATATAFHLDTETSQINSGNSSGQTFSQISGAPHTVGAYTEISRQALLQSIGVESGVTADLTRLVATQLDADAQVGSGTNGAPVGVLNLAGVTSVSGTTFSLSTAMSFVTGLANALDDSAGWSLNRAAAITLRTRQEVTGGTRMLMEENPLVGSIAGFPARSTLNLASGVMIFGAWSRMKIPVWGSGVVIEVNPFTNFQAGIIGVRAFLTADVCIDYQSAFAATSTFS
jgi:HK97 family phage major capsid protein